MAALNQALLERQQANIQAAVDDESSQMMLEILMEFARERSYSPTFRLDAAKATAPYVHSKAPEQRPPIAQILAVMAAIKPRRGAITADNHPITVMLDFVNPIGTGRSDAHRHAASIGRKICRFNPRALTGKPTPAAVASASREVGNLGY